MDLSGRLRCWAFARPRVLVVDAAAQDGLRWAVEAAIDDRGWDLAASPADTDVVVVLGEPGPALTDAIDVLWSQVPRPRHAVTIADVALLDQQLDAAVEELASSSVAEADDGSTVGPEDRLAAGRSPDSGHAGHDMHGGHADHDMGGDGGHHMHHGGTVAGLAMAQTAPDRDGLELDTLTVALGPVLPGWPTGLVLRAQLHGDVLSDVQLAWTDGGGPETGRLAPRHDPKLVALDHLARFLVVAGWPRQAGRARRALAGLRSADPDRRARAGRAATRVAGQVRRSRTLVWSVRGMGLLPASTPVASDDGGSRSRRDVLDRVRQWCDLAAGQTERPVPVLRLEVLARVLEGGELAAARLVVASVAPERAHVPSVEAVTGG